MIDKTLTYRLIGASIILLSTAIILPLILDGERPPELDIQVEVTSPPEFSPVVIAPAQPLETLHNSSLPDESSTSDIKLIPTPKPAKDVKVTVNAPAVESKVESTPKPELKLKAVVKPLPKKDVAKVPAKKKPAPIEAKKAAVVPGRWVVQIASFKSRENATRLVKRLKDAKYSAYSKTQRSLHKVYVGPEFKRETSNKIRDEIHKKFKLAGIVVKYSVN